jgi:biotin carboxyl carrier protein
LTVNVDVNGRRYAVKVTRRDGSVLVSVDGREREVDVKEIGDVLSLVIGTRSYEVTAGETTVHVDGMPIEVTVVPARPSWGRTSAAQTGAEGPQQVAAPMPGKIVKLLVKPGERVEPRQGLVVVEAMKMENELRSPKTGRVKDVAVMAGASVEAGRVLVVIE